MKRLTNFNLATALQVVAILILFLFGYPGCTSNKISTVYGPHNTTVEKTTPVITAAMELKNNMVCQY